MHLRACAGHVQYMRGATVAETLLCISLRSQISQWLFSSCVNTDAVYGSEDKAGRSSATAHSYFESPWRHYFDDFRIIVHEGPDQGRYRRIGRLGMPLLRRTYDRVSLVVKEFQLQN